MASLTRDEALDTYEAGEQFAFVVEITEYDKDTGFEALEPVSDDAERSLQTTLTAMLGFQILSYVKGRFTAGNMEKLLLRIVGAVFPETTGCVLFILSGHGLENRFFTSDGRAFTYDTVSHCLGSNVSLISKPKWLMFPTCRGHSDCTTQNTTASVCAKAAEAMWWTEFRTVHIIGDTIRSYATPDTYASYGRHYLDALTSLVQRLAADGQQTVELLELLRQLTKCVMQSSTPMLKKVATFDCALPSRLVLRIGSNAQKLTASQAKILEGEEANRCWMELQLKPEEQLTIREKWLFRALAAGKVNRWAVVDLLQKEKQKQMPSGRKSS